MEDGNLLKINTSNNQKREGRHLAYLRVSTDKQDLDNQKLEVLSYAQKRGVSIQEFIEVEISSRENFQKRKLNDLFSMLRKGDTLLVAELSRFGRSLGQIIQLVDELMLGGVHLVCLKEGLDLYGQHNLQSKVTVAMFGLLAEIERDLISQRTKAGLAAAKAKGVKLGRPHGPGKSKLDGYRLEIEALLKNGSTKAFIARRYGSSTANLHHWLRRNGIKTEPRGKNEGVNEGRNPVSHQTP